MAKPAFEEAMKALAAQERQGLKEHPSPDELLAYHIGELQSEEIERVQDHLAVCGECSQLVLSLGPVVRSSAKEGGSKITGGQKRIGQPIDSNMRRESWFCPQSCHF